MKTARLPFASRTSMVLLALVLCLPMRPAHAGMIGAEAAASPDPAQLDRAKVQAFVDRADVKQRLQALGVSGLVAGDRVASLSDAEVHELAQRIDAMPAGGALSQNDLIIILLIAILVALVL